tara:strand:+ start:61 stop:1074 length:1014 start_codon:yes stop_codon:yes gene_type:complete
MIKFFIPGWDNNYPNRASFRFRALVPLKGMRPEDKIINDVKQANKGDVVILAKKTRPEDMFYLKSVGIKTVYDICDNRWRKYVSPQWIERVIKPHNVICANVDAIVTTCPGMQMLIRKHIGRDSIIIPDPVEAVKEEPRVALKSKRFVKVFTYGNSKHFMKVYWNQLIQNWIDIGVEFKIYAILDRSKKYKIMYKDQIEKGRMEIHEYDFKKQYELMRECDIVFLPIIANSMPNLLDIKAKSPNRIIDAIYSGKPVITNNGVDTWGNFRRFADFVGWARKVDYTSFGVAIKALINRPKEEINKRILEGQRYIEDNHSPEVIGKQWIELENKIGRTGF